MQDAVARGLSAYEKVATREIVVLLEEAQDAIFRCRLPFTAIAEGLPNGSRTVPDYRSLRLAGLYAGTSIAVLALVIFIAVGLKVSTPIGVLGGFAALMTAGPLAAAGWMWAPTFPFHDYRPFSMVRRVTLEKGDDPPINALNVSKAWKKRGPGKITRRSYLEPPPSIGMRKWRMSAVGSVPSLMCGAKLSL